MEPLLPGDVERYPAGDENLEAGAGCDQARQPWIGGVHHVLHVVEHEQHVAWVEPFRQELEE